MSGNEFLFFEVIFIYSPINPSNTLSVSPESVTDLLSSHLINKSPPSKTTLFSLVLLFNDEAATNVAHAPDPHAEVIPTPLSQTLILKDLSSNTDTNSIFANLGKIECFSNLGPIEFIFKFSSSSELFINITACGFPMDKQKASNSSNLT